MMSTPTPRIAPGEPVLRAEKLRLGYGGRAVLDDVDLCVGAGEFWFLLGRNGAGKSTLVNALLGLVPLMAGRIRLHPALAARAATGYVPQRTDLNSTLPTTVREFVLLGLAGLRTSRRDRAERLEWALERVGLAHFGKRSFWSLSSGQRQRVTVARALARRPRLLVMDEPTAGLDAAAESALLECLADLNRDDHLTILFVSHDLATAARYASHVALFNGRSVEAGRTRQVLTQANLARIYGIPLDLGWYPRDAAACGRFRTGETG